MGHAVHEVNEIWQNDRGALIYVTMQYGELWPGGPPGAPKK